MHNHIYPTDTLYIPHISYTNVDIHLTYTPLSINISLKLNNIFSISFFNNSILYPFTTDIDI